CPGTEAMGPLVVGWHLAAPRVLPFLPRPRCTLWHYSSLVRQSVQHCLLIQVYTVVQEPVGQTPQAGFPVRVTKARLVRASMATPSGLPGTLIQCRPCISLLTCGSLPPAPRATALGRSWSRRPARYGYAVPMVVETAAGDAARPLARPRGQARAGC